ncbi:MAG: MFS transporter [Polyangiales bacterium]
MGSSRVQATLFFALFCVAASVNLQAPLFELYVRDAGLSQPAVTFVFAAYVAGLLPVFLFFGGLPELRGPRPVVLSSLALGLVATGLVLLSPTLTPLFVARVLQGVAIAIAMPAVTVWVAQVVTPARGASVTALATTLGFGSGPMATSLLGDGASRTPPSYLGMAVLLGVALVGVFSLPAAVPLESSAPTKKQSPILRGGVWLYGAALGLGWGVAGVVLSILPLVLRPLGAIQYSGPAVFGMLAAGALAQRKGGKLAPRLAIRIGALIQCAAFIILAAGAWTRSAALLCLGAVAGGVASHGFTFAGGLRAVAASATDGERSRSVSGYFLVGYFGFAGLSLGIGFVARFASLEIAISAAGAALGILSALMCLHPALRALED